MKIVRLNKCLHFFLVKAGATLWIAWYLLFLLWGGMACRDEGWHSHVMRVDGGYGYVVLYGRDTLIVQPYMPAVGGKLPFSSEKHARAVGEEVCRKLREGKPPVISREDVEFLK